MATLQDRIMRVYTRIMQGGLLAVGDGGAMPPNGANGMSDIEGKAAREAVSECGQRTNFKSKSKSRGRRTRYFFWIAARFCGVVRVRGWRGISNAAAMIRPPKVLNGHSAKNASCVYIHASRERLREVLRNRERPLLTGMNRAAGASEMDR